MKKIVFVLILVFSKLTYGACECVCVSGEVEALCESTVEIKPICAPQVCPIQLPSIKPIPAPTVPPVGTSKCEQKQVYNNSTHRYEWETICK